MAGEVWRAMSDPFCEAHKRKAEEARKALERAEGLLRRGQIDKRIEDGLRMRRSARPGVKSRLSATSRSGRYET